MPDPFTPTDTLCVNAVRTLAIDAVQQANSGHPGAPMGMAPLGYALFNRVLTYDPAAPLWPNRDRFVLSNGHASMLLHALLNLSGYGLPISELKREAIDWPHAAFEVQPAIAASWNACEAGAQREAEWLDGGQAG